MPVVRKVSASAARKESQFNCLRRAHSKSAPTAPIDAASVGVNQPSAMPLMTSTTSPAISMMRNIAARRSGSEGAKLTRRAAELRERIWRLERRDGELDGMQRVVALDAAGPERLVKNHHTGIGHEGGDGRAAVPGALQRGGRARVCVPCIRRRNLADHGFELGSDRVTVTAGGGERGTTKGRCIADGSRTAP